MLYDRPTSSHRRRYEIALKLLWTMQKISVHSAVTVPKGCGAAALIQNPTFSSDVWADRFVKLFCSLSDSHTADFLQPDLRNYYLFPFTLACLNNYGYVFPIFQLGKSVMKIYKYFYQVGRFKNINLSKSGNVCFTLHMHCYMGGYGSYVVIIRSSSKLKADMNPQRLDIWRRHLEKTSDKFHNW